MDIYFDYNDSGILYTSQPLLIDCFTEYGLKRQTINTFRIDESINKSGKILESILIVPMTHVNNLWHFMHHMYIVHKFVSKYSIKTNNVLLCFFDGFYKRQGDITKSIYIDILMKGLGFNKQNFLDNLDIFKQNKSIKCNNIYVANEMMSFTNEPDFSSFKNNIISSFNLNYINNKVPNITFVLRINKCTSRIIKNIDQVKDSLKQFNINYIDFSDFSIEDQIKISVNTDIMIGLHGAGLTWSIFMKDRAKLLEIYPGNSNTDNYIRWCGIANIKYDRMISDICEGNESSFRNANVVINDAQINNIKNHILSYSSENL